MVFVNVRSASPFRISVTTDVSPDLTASDYVLTRKDNASTSSSVIQVFATGPKSVDLVIGPTPLIDGIIYVIALPGQPGAPSAPVGYRQPLLQNQVPVSPAEDPEAEAFGVDIDWFADAMTASGDTPTIRGRQCFINDLAVIAVTNKGEIFHRPDAGAGVIFDTNAPMTEAQANKTVGSLTREWYKDPRTKPGGVTVRVDRSAATGRLSVYGTVLPLAIDDPAVVKLPGGGT